MAAPQEPAALALQVAMEPVPVAQAGMARVQAEPARAEAVRRRILLVLFEIGFQGVNLKRGRGVSFAGIYSWHCHIVLAGSIPLKARQPLMRFLQRHKSFQIRLR